MSLVFFFISFHIVSECLGLGVSSLKLLKAMRCYAKDCSVSCFVLLNWSHFVGSFQSCSYLEYLCHVIIIVANLLSVRVETSPSLFQ